MYYLNVHFQNLTEDEKIKIGQQQAAMIQMQVFYVVHDFFPIYADQSDVVRTMINIFNKLDLDKLQFRVLSVPNLNLVGLLFK